MDLSRRGFFKGVAALFAGAVAAQLPSCTTGSAPLAVAQEGRINKYKGEILAHAVPTEILTATKIKRRNAQAYWYGVRRMLPYSTDPMIEGLTPLPENLLEPGPRVG